jgi:ribokinase
VQICVVGSLNVDRVATVRRLPAVGETVEALSYARFPGGKGGNQACAAARLGRGGVTPITVSMVGLVGDDEDGVWLREGLVTDGVEVTGVATARGVPTGTALITVDPQGENQIVVIGGANQALSPAALSPQHAILAGADVLLVQLEVPLPTVQTAIRVGREKGATIILDPAPARPLPDGLLRLCDHVTPNETELRTLLEGGAGPVAMTRDEALAGARALVARGARGVIVKRGAAGALGLGPGGEVIDWPAPRVTAVDTTAAGDAWNGAFAVALAEGATLRDAGAFATAAGSASVTRPGAQPALPGRADVLALLSAG